MAAAVAGAAHKETERENCNLNIYYIISARSFVLFHFGVFTYEVRGGFTLYYVPIYTLPLPSPTTTTVAHSTRYPIPGRHGHAHWLYWERIRRLVIRAEQRQTAWPLIAPPGLGPCPAAALLLLPFAYSLLLLYPRWDLSLALHLCHLLSCLFAFSLSYLLSPLFVIRSFVVCVF